jgi:hypothetical protein
MIYAETLERNMNLTLTENNAVSNSTTGSNVLDFFSVGGALRNRSDKEVISLLDSAWAEDRLLTLKAMFYFRDVRGGQGQRNAFRVQLKHLANTHPAVVLRSIGVIQQYGRWDDLYALFDTPLEQDAINIINAQLELDLLAMNRGDPVSLLCKWLKSENTSSKESRRLACKTRVSLGMNSKTYRIILAKLRKSIRVVEVAMSAKVYGAIDYERVPSQAMLKYRSAFLRNDEERFSKYLEDVKTGRAKINAATLYPQQIVHAIWHSNINVNVAESLWNNMPDFVDGAKENAIAVVDTSGSMMGTPIEVSVSLGLYLAERAKGPYANKFITFSRRPTMQTIQGETILDKVNGMRNAEWEMNTNIEAVFDIILQTAIDTSATQEEMLDKVYIISDMEFDSAVDSYYDDNVPTHDRSLFNTIRDKYINAGYKIPQIVFWNVDSRNNQFPMCMDDRGFLNVSGYSPSIFKNLVNNTIVSPYDFMMEILNSERYEQIEI